MVVHAVRVDEQGALARDGSWRAVLAEVGLYDEPLDADIERWLGALRRRTGAAATRLLVTGTPTPPGGPDGGRAVAAHDRLEAPVVVDGELVATLVLVDPARGAWSREDEQTLEDAAAAVATEVALRLAKRAAAQAQQLIVAHGRVHDLIAGAAPLGEILVAVVESIERHDPDVLACVVLLDPATSTLHPGAGPSLPDTYLAAIDGVVIGPNVGTCGAAAWSGELTISADLSRDPKWAPIRAVAHDAGLARCWSMPIKAPNGEVLGTLAFYGTTPGEPLPEQLEQLADWARVAGIAIERHRALDRLVHDARHDGLTGLPNRRATLEALEGALELATAQRRVAVLFVDLDGLKVLNDTLGHDRADDMLREVAERLAAAAPGGCTVGRLGGDEFVVVIPEVPGQAEAAALAIDLLEAIARPLPGLDAPALTASIGIALAGSDAVEAREVLREADSAMYVAKRAGRDRCAFYDGSQRVRSERRMALARELRGAHARGEIRLDYQPIVALATGELVAVEAVPHWASPTQGEVGPLELRQVAEELGAAVPLGAWALREGCEALARCAERSGRSVGLALSCSASQLEQPGFVRTVQQDLDHTGLAPGQLALEIDDAALVRTSAAIGAALTALARLGVRTILDHNGANWVSPDRLKELPLRGVTLGGDFISLLGEDPRDEAVVGSVLQIAAAFDLEVTARGVARAAQHEALVRLGCDLALGPAIGEAVAAEGLRSLLAALA